MADKKLHKLCCFYFCWSA